MSSSAYRNPPLADFSLFRVAQSKGHEFDIRITQIGGRSYWKVVVLSRGCADFANAYETGGVMRASVSISDPPGYLLFRCDVVNGKPDPARNFDCKFGAINPLT